MNIKAVITNHPASEYNGTEVLLTGEVRQGEVLKFEGYDIKFKLRPCSKGYYCTKEFLHVSSTGTPAMLPIVNHEWLTFPKTDQVQHSNKISAGV